MNILLKSDLFTKFMGGFVLGIIGFVTFQTVWAEPGQSDVASAQESDAR